MHYARCSEMLDLLIVCSASEMCRRLKISARTHWHYLVQSRLGKEELQAITWCGVTAPYHVHVQNNLPALQAAQVSQSVLEKCRDGVYTDSFFQGHKQYQQISKRQHDDEVMFGMRTEGDFDLYDESGERVAERVWLKPDSATSLAVLQAYDKRFRSTQTIEHQYGGVLRLARDGSTQPAVTVESSQPMLDDAEQTEARPTQLALATPARDSAEMDELIRDDAFAPTAVDFVDATGKRTTLIAAADPLLAKEEPAPVVEDDLGLPPDPPAEPPAPPVNKPINADVKFESLMRRQAGGLRGRALGPDGYPKSERDHTGRGGPPPGAVKMV